MKRYGLDHPKGRRLGAALGIPLYAQVGIRECIYHFTARHAIQGDIGKWSDADIAAAVGWPIERVEDLVRALVETRLLEAHPTHRLVVHDWHEHCDESCRKTVANKKLEFVTRTPGYEDETRRFTYFSGNIPEDLGNLPPKPKPQPEPQPEPKRERSPANAEELARSGASSAGFEAWYAVYPRKRKPRDAARAYERAIARISKSQFLTPADAATWLLERTRIFASSPAGQVSDDGDFRPYPATWLNADEFETDPVEWQRRSASSRSNGAGQQYRDGQTLGAL